VVRELWGFEEHSEALPRNIAVSLDKTIGEFCVSFIEFLLHLQVSLEDVLAQMSLDILELCIGGKQIIDFLNICLDTLVLDLRAKFRENLLENCDWRHDELLVLIILLENLLHLIFHGYVDLYEF
jgi:hypothetical protein